METEVKRYYRKETYPIQLILSSVELHHTKRDIIVLDGDDIKLGSDRYKTFKVKGIDCVICGAKGKYFAKERDKYNKASLAYHLNLYAVNSKGEEVLMTKDHIIARDKGGPDHIDNYQPMCTVCNAEKSNK
jgi:5-methylcytosine-specific restriction endonuclease McrA